MARDQVSLRRTLDVVSWGFDRLLGSICVPGARLDHPQVSRTGKVAFSTGGEKNYVGSQSNYKMHSFLCY